MPGRYIVTGRVIYNNKLTFEKGTVINVNYRQITKHIVKFKLLPIIIYIILLGLILFLILRIRKRRKDERRRA